MPIPVKVAAPPTSGVAIPVQEGGALGAQVVRPGQVQFGPMLLGAGTAAGWVELVGWRDLPEAALADAPRPQAHGVYPGSVLGDALTVTFTALIRGRVDDKAAAVATFERWTAMDGVEYPLVVDDGDGPSVRWGRVVSRVVPQGVHYRHAPVEVSVQWVCSDPRRYSLAEVSSTVTVPSSVGGLEYPLTYPLDYGATVGGSTVATNLGSMPTPLRAVFQGPLTGPVLSASDWSMGFDLTLAAGDTLMVDTLDGTALLNGADRLYTLTPASDPLERCTLRVGATDLSLAAASGTGSASVSFRHARM